MKGWKRQKKPPEGESDALILERLIPKVTIVPIVVPPLESVLAVQRKEAEPPPEQIQEEVMKQHIDVDDAMDDTMELSDIFNQYA